MSEQMPTPEDDNLKRKLVAGGAVVALVAAMPMVHKTTEHSTSPANPGTAVEQVSGEAVDPLPASPSELKIELSNDKVQNEYRESFQTTPADQDSSSGQVADVVSSLNDDQLENLTSISVTGLASAEDEAADEGLQTPSSQNQGLAEQRANIAEGAVIDAFDQRGKDVEDIVSVQAEEHQWSDEELAQAEQLATEAGYDSAGAMVEAYNDDPDSAPENVKGFLQGLLDANRGATITMNFESPNTGLKELGRQDGEETAQVAKSAETVSSDTQTVIAPDRPMAVLPEQPNPKPVSVENVATGGGGPENDSESGGVPSATESGEDKDARKKRSLKDMVGDGVTIKQSGEPEDPIGRGSTRREQRDDQHAKAPSKEVKGRKPVFGQNSSKFFPGNRF